MSFASDPLTDRLWCDTHSPGDFASRNYVIDKSGWFHSCFAQSIYGGKSSTYTVIAIGRERDRRYAAMNRNHRVESGSHSQGSHDAYGVKMADGRAGAIVKEFKRLGVKARINLIEVNAKTVKGGMAGANVTWHP
ncbi:hypothetical protein GALL_440190 [mine drainage metagenome]|uniref:Uncharacterized protein n=1 Tax=mine drainage metagenome TaxID=410659 RepID=A0A1J5QED7_9ZZZZ